MIFLHKIIFLLHYVVLLVCFFNKFGFMFINILIFIKNIV
ncbi:hypothetical protein FM107_13815 [Sphingobacterium sp. JB170]|nr:hypothetical protein FM107_13815 [Sphingobacterium sp. JB170]